MLKYHKSYAPYIAEARKVIKEIMASDEYKNSTDKENYFFGIVNDRHYDLTFHPLPEQKQAHYDNLYNKVIPDVFYEEFYEKIKNPLTKSGKRIMRGMKKRYGSRGKNIFYATMKKYPERTKKWHNPNNEDYSMAYAFIHLLNQNKDKVYTFKEYADLIKRHYDLKNPRTNMAYNMLLKYPDYTFTYSHHKGGMWIVKSPKTKNPSWTKLTFNLGDKLYQEGKYYGTIFNMGRETIQLIDDTSEEYKVWRELPLDLQEAINDGVLEVRKKNPSELQMGIKEESEHKDLYEWLKTHKLPSKKEFYKRIAKPHLKEDRKYYSKLKKAMNPQGWKGDFSFDTQWGHHFYSSPVYKSEQEALKILFATIKPVKVDQSVITAYLKKNNYVIRTFEKTGKGLFEITGGNIKKIGNPDSEYGLIYEKKKKWMNPLKYKATGKGIDADYRMYVERAGIFGKAFFGHRASKRERELMNRIWKTLLKQYHPEEMPSTKISKNPSSSCKVKNPTGLNVKLPTDKGKLITYFLGKLYEVDVQSVKKGKPITFRIKGDKKNVDVIATKDKKYIIIKPVNMKEVI